MSCFDLITCPNAQIFERINCNFTIRYIHYICNPINTCKRNDNLYDCCASNISNCIIEQFDFQTSPTIKPTILTNVESECENTCNIAPRTNQCYWFENQNLNISCINKHGNFCCSHERNECCQVNIIQTYIIFGSVILILLFCIFYKYFVYSYTRVIPEKSTDLYQLHP